MGSDTLGSKVLGEIDLEEKKYRKTGHLQKKNKEETLSYLNPNLKYLYLEPRVFFKNF